MNKERRLGRGLEALLGHPLEEQGAPIFGIHPPPEGEAAPAEPHAPGSLVHLDVHSIRPNRYQPRQDFNEEDLEGLAESIRQHGVIQPIVVRRAEESAFELVSGERRLRAAIRAGWAEIPAWIREADERQLAEVAIVENVQRKDLNPLEKAASFQRYLETYGVSQAELAARIQLDRSTIANLIRLLELPEEVQAALRAGAIGGGHARALLPLGDEAEQVRFCRQIIVEQLSVRVVEQMVTEAIRAADSEPLAIAGSTAVMAGSATASVLGEASIGRKGPKKIGSRSEHLTSLEQELRTALGTKVEIRETSRQKGRVIIHFGNAEEFERIREQIVSSSAGQSRQVG